MVWGVEQRLVGLGFRLLQGLGDLAQHGLRLRQTGVCGAFPKMMVCQLII
jgi:hypothetical protein